MFYLQMYLLYSLPTLSVEYFDQLLGAVRQVHVVYLAQLLGAVLFLHFISDRNSMDSPCSINLFGDELGTFALV